MISYYIAFIALFKAEDFIVMEIHANVATTLLSSHRKVIWKVLYFSHDESRQAQALGKTDQNYSVKARKCPDAEGRTARKILKQI